MTDKKNKKGPPKLVNKGKDPSISADLRQLGIRLSESLPTYDMPMDLAEPNDWNTNEMDDEAFMRLVEEIEKTGIVSAIQVVPRKGEKFRIIGGENRWRACQSLGMTSIPVHILTDERFMDPELQELLSVRLNVLHGNQNPEKFMKLYEKYKSVYGQKQLQSLFGYTETDAWKKITRGVEQAVADTGVGGGGLLRELKRKSGKVKGIDGLGKLLNQLFKTYGSDLKHSFMFLSYGGKTHVYVIMSDELRGAVDRLATECREQGKDMSEILTSLIVGGHS